MRKGFRKTLKSWISASFCSTTGDDVGPSRVTPLFRRLSVAPASSPSASLGVADLALSVSPQRDGTPTSRSAPNSTIQSCLPTALTAPTPENELRTSVPLGTQCALSIAQVAAELAPIPYIGPLAGCLTLMFQAVERTKVNKEQWKLLQGRCVMVTRIAGAQVLNYGQQHYPGVERATRKLQETLNKISSKVQLYNEMNTMIVFLRFESITDEIQGLFGDLDTCLNLFSFATDVAQLQWVSEFRAVQEKELAELQSVRTLLAGVDTNIDKISHNPDEIKKVVNVLQEVLDTKFEVLQDPSITTGPSFVEAQQLVRTILTVTNLKLPPKLLTGKVCILDYNVPIKTGSACDVYSVTFLGGEKVAKKVFISDRNDRESVQRYAEGILRVEELRREFRSDYMLPLYGVGMEAFEGDQYFRLYTISPLMRNLDAVTHLKQYRNIAGMKEGILRIITDAALGLQYLHNRNPPVVHSGMRGDNILITDSGGGTLGVFGLGKAVESVFNMPLHLRAGKTDPQRWTAPELFADDIPVLKTSSDVWGWAMTALELVSGSVPYHSHTQIWTVMLKITKGPPQRKDHIKFEDYAYRPNEMWELLERCWNYDPEERPTIDDVVMRLKEIAQMEEYVKHRSNNAYSLSGRGYPFYVAAAGIKAGSAPDKFSVRVHLRETDKVIDFPFGLDL